MLLHTLISFFASQSQFHLCPTALLSLGLGTNFPAPFHLTSDVLSQKIHFQFFTFLVIS